MMREKHSHQPSDSPAAEVCDICGDVGALDAISKCFKCKINKQHFYCGKNYPQNIYDDWYCDDCERETMASPKHGNGYLHKTLVSNLSARVHDEGTRSAHDGKHWREERMVTKGKVKCIPSAEVINLSSGSKKGESPLKTIRYSNLSPSRIAGPVHQKTPIHRLNTPVTLSLLPVTKHINHVILGQRSPISHLPKAADPAGAKNATAVKEPSMRSEGLCGRSPKKQFRPPIIVASPVVETKVATPGIEIYKSSEASNALSLEMQFPQPISSAAESAGAKNATAVKETSLPSEALCGFPTKEQFLPPVSPVRPSAEVKVAAPGKEIYKANEASDAVSLEKQFRQPIGSAADPAGTIDATTVKETSTPHEGLCELSEKHFSPLTSPVGPSVETRVGSPGEEIHKASEVSDALSLKKQFPQPQPISLGAKDLSAVKETSTPHEGLRGQFSEKQFSPLTSPIAIKPSVETKVASLGKEIYKASEASNALSLEKQSLQPISSEIKTEKEMNVSIEAWCAPSPKKQFMQGTTSGHQVSCDLDPIASDVEDGEVMNVEPKAMIQGSALGSSWRGRFEIRGETFKIINSWFKAHPRFRVNRNVVGILLRMPEVLQFKLIHRRDVWIELFQGDCPDEDDIGLYFFSGDHKRSSDYNFLRMFIEEKDLSMRCDLSGAELFLFTSKVLLADSQKLDGENFLWGVFRPIKKLKYVSKLYEELPHIDHQPSYATQNTGFNKYEADDCAVDMEIDMLAGNDVGIVDIAVPRVFSPGGYSNEGHAKLFSSQEIKKEPGLECPPGFEEMFRLKKFQKL